MLLFGHVGISLGVAALLSVAVNRNTTKHASDGERSLNTATWRVLRAGFAVRHSGLDYRLIILGALLPDLIDKPIGVIFFGSNGRLFTHTLFFVLTMVFIGLYLYLKGKPSVLIVALCSAGHLVLDQMWLQPDILLWPAQGWTMPSYDLVNWTAFADWLASMRHGLGTSLLVFVPEMFGAAVVTVFLLWPLLRKKCDLA